MPYAARVLPEHRLAVVRPYGEVTPGEILGAMRAPLDDPAWDPAFAVAWDLRLVEHTDLGPEDLHALAAFMRANDGRMGVGRREYLVVRDLEGMVGLLLNRMSGRYGRVEVEVFTAASAAAAWLGVPEDVLGPERTAG